MHEITLPAAMAILLLVFVTAVGTGLVLHRFEVRRGVLDERDRKLVGEGLGGAVGFLGGSTAFLLGVLMLASVSHFNATDDVVKAEALAYSAAYDGTVALAVPDQSRIRRDLVCLMRAVTTTSWTATEAKDPTGSENTHEWRTRTLTDTNAVGPRTLAQENALSTLQSQLVEAARAGQHRLLAAQNDLPRPLWIVVYISIFLLTVALTALLRPNPAVAAISLGAILLLSGAMVWTLSAFAQPFTKDGVYISPEALQSVMVRLQSAYPGPVWGPCEALARS